MKVTFLGAAQEVTGSRYLVEHNNTRILVDCGFFQGDSESRARNEYPFPVPIDTLDAVVVTHAHIDHTGYIPALVKQGFKGKIYCSKATYALCSILLVDSGAIQEYDAKNVDEKIYTKLPLYTAQDATYALSFFQTVDYRHSFSVNDCLRVTLYPAGHILGASFVMVSDGKQVITFSGDVGRPNDPIMRPPAQLVRTDYLILESTYGDKTHGQDDPLDTLRNVVNQTVTKKGKIVIPVFAVARAQLILYVLYELKKKNSIPDIPIFFDSPMAIKVNDVYKDFFQEHKLSSRLCSEIFDSVIETPTKQESINIDYTHTPSIIIAGSGMADGGRVRHHFKHLISDSKNSIVFVGFQAPGTDGRALVDGAQEITIQGVTYQVQATIQKIDSFSAHADSDELLTWLSYCESSLKTVFLTHGEIDAAKTLKSLIEKRFGWQVIIPANGESFVLD
jgi:metallo-beta-lactamase family protein